MLEVIFQSTLPRRERRYRCLNCCKSCCISIHAPAEGATQFMKQTGGDIGISIHAPAEGATQFVKNMESSFMDFNPRSRGGSDLSVLVNFCIDTLFQSTLPRRERLVTGYITRQFITYFNPRSRGGSDFFHISQDLSFYKFQSTLPRRERRSPLIDQPGIRSFQSTLPRRERRYSSCHFNSFLIKFQSTLPRRERQQTYTIFSE